jgi:hypothetical protein
MNIAFAKYINNEDGEPTDICAHIDGVVWSVSISSAGSRYQEIMRLVEAGELTIEPADSA